MSVQETIDASANLYRLVGWPLLKACWLSATLMYLGYEFLLSAALPRIAKTAYPGNLAAQLMEMTVLLMIISCVIIPLILFGASWVTAVSAQVAASVIQGNTFQIGHATATANRNIFRLFGLTAAQSFARFGAMAFSAILIFGGGFLAKSVPDNAGGDFLSGLALVAGFAGIAVGIILSLVFTIQYSLAVPAMLVEGIGVRAALKRSKNLLKRRKGVPDGSTAAFNGLVLTVFLFLLLIAGISTIYSYVNSRAIYAVINQFPLGGYLPAFLERLPVFLALWVIVPFGACLNTMIYFERRVRLEGFDIEQIGLQTRRKALAIRYDL